MVYMTCSILNKENEGQIKKFLEGEGKQFRVVQD
jgi:16S rRNA C967 or C1407 C5-methylase (RsmB/RsmF family)